MLIGPSDSYFSVPVSYVYLIALVMPSRHHNPFIFMQQYHIIYSNQVNCPQQLSMTTPNLHVPDTLDINKYEIIKL